jgi:glycerol dehydrogenase-like iron-containing ADH family enzyme
VTFLSRMMAGGKFGIGDVIAAYSEVDRSSGAHSLRERLKEVPPEAAHKALLELEDALESATRDALEGRSGDTGAALEPVRARLEPA